MKFAAAIQAVATVKVAAWTREDAAWTREVAAWMVEVAAPAVEVAVCASAVELPASAVEVPISIRKLAMIRGAARVVVASSTIVEGWLVTRGPATDFVALPVTQGPLAKFSPGAVAISLVRTVGVAVFVRTVPVGPVEGCAAMSSVVASSLALAGVGLARFNPRKPSVMGIEAIGDSGELTQDAIKLGFHRIGSAGHGW